jgi:hypothetical protein
MDSGNATELGPHIDPIRINQSIYRGKSLLISSPLLALPKIERTISRQLDGSSGNTTRRIRVTQLLVYELAGTPITTRHTQRTAATNRSPRARIVPSCFFLFFFIFLVFTTWVLPCIYARTADRLNILVLFNTTTYTKPSTNPNRQVHDS